jgi:hypothetical protein
MTNRKTLPGLTAQLKDKLIQQALERRLHPPSAAQPANAAQTSVRRGFESSRATR